jgi:CubicO group peptidase (beta-lactamase class C family)
MRTPSIRAAASISGLVAAWLLAGAPASLDAQDGRPAEAAEMIAAIEGVQVGDSTGELGRFTLEELLDTLNVPGLSLAVIHGFEVHWAKGYGVRDVTTGAPVDTETVFQAASISKPVAAMGSLRAVQDGLFGLDDDVNDHLVSWRLDGAGFTDRHAVTPRTLMSHVSGLGDAFGFPGYDPAGPLPTAVQILDGEAPSNTRPLFMEREPWAAFEYSGGGVTLQQLLLEDARGRPFAEVLADDVLRPIGMSRSTFEQPMPSTFASNAARAHDGAGEVRGEARWHVYPEQAAAGLWTTATDLARFAIEVQRSIRGESNRVLDRVHAREMVTPVGVGDYAVGFGMRAAGQGRYFGHGGSNWGFRGDLMAHTVKGYGYAALTNGDRGGQLIAEIRRRIERAYGWDTLTPSPPRGYETRATRTEIDLGPEETRRLIGDYEPESDVPVAIDLFEGRLRFQAEGEQPFPMFAASDREFWLGGSNAEVVFDIVGGEVRGFTLFTGGVQRRWIRAR